jgi:hypothetical protein
MFPPSSIELCLHNLELYAIYFVKPYDIDKAFIFMRLYGFSLAYYAESESVIIFYQKNYYVPIENISNFNHTLLDADIREGLERYRSRELIFDVYLNKKVCYITFSN